MARLPLKAKPLVSPAPATRKATAQALTRPEAESALLHDGLVSDHVTEAQWAVEAEFAAGEVRGVAVTDDALRLTDGLEQRTYLDPHVADAIERAYEQGSWASEWRSFNLSPTQFLVWWNAHTPPGTWVEIIARLGSPTHETDWYVMGRWSERDVADGGAIMRTSVDGQAFDGFRVDQDLFNLETDHPYDRYQVGVRLVRAAGSDASPIVWALGAAARDGQVELHTPPSGLPEVVIDVPALSQQRHRDRYPEWGSGGQVWCSPTSVSMILAHLGLGPDAAELTWIDDGPDPVVVHATRNCWDYAYRGAGNWPFCTAYAASHGARARVTWLTSLREAEVWVRKGVPLVASVAHRQGELDGAGYETGGHLLVIVGFSADGNVICNDPASHSIASNDAVRVTYRRDQFEKAWLDHSGGAVYIISSGATSA